MGVLITGGMGVLGSMVTEELVGRGERVVLYARHFDRSLLAPEVLQKTRILRQFMYNMDEIEAMEMVLKSMRATKSNVEFFDMMRRGG